MNAKKIMADAISFAKIRKDHFIVIAMKDTGEKGKGAKVLLHTRQAL